MIFYKHRFDTFFIHLSSSLGFEYCTVLMSYQKQFGRFSGRIRIKNVRSIRLKFSQNLLFQTIVNRMLEKMYACLRLYVIEIFRIFFETVEKKMFLRRINMFDGKRKIIGKIKSHFASLTSDSKRGRGHG